jgi:O-antigen ligase
MRKALVPLCFLLVAYAQALTGGRMGYVTWGLLGMTIGVLRWRRMLLLGPVALVLLVAIVPQAAERMLQGFGVEAQTEGKLADDYQITSGRTVIWPYVVDKIREKPVFGYGRMAMVRTGLSEYLFEDLKESFPHPHNAYLELLLDNGLLGFSVVIPFFLWALTRSLALFLRREDRVATASGGVAFSLTLSLLIASFGSQTFYPREGWVGMWAAIFLTIRLAQGSPSTSPRKKPPPPTEDPRFHARRT